MAANALEEKINKIRQQNEEIRRRHEEVEEDKKNAAKLNALVQMVPSTDWPERKEPPEFSNPPRPNNKSKPAKEHHEQPQQYHSASGEGRKAHTFSQGQGPPPDPKYNFLADAEREESNLENTKESPPNKGQKHSRGIYKRKSGGKDGMQRDYRMNRGPHRDEHQPEYEAWRAERNRIDEDRISRQRTAEGNWRREWDNDKVHIVDEVTRPEAKLGDYAKKDHKDFDRRYHVNGNDYASHNRGGHRSYRGNSRHFHYNYENRSNNMYHQDGHVKHSLLPGSEERTVVATDKSLKVTLNQGNMTKGPVMSVKVNSPSIAGTGRVGPRQRSRVTYSSHSDVEVTSPDTESFSRPKSYEDKVKGIHHDNGQKSPNSRKSQLPPRKKDFSNKSLYVRKKEIRREDVNESPQKHENESPQKEDKDSGSESYQLNSQKPEENTAKELQNDKVLTVTNEKESNMICGNESNANNTQVKSKDNHNDDLNSCMDEQNEIHANEEGETVLQNSDLLEFKVKTVIETSEKVEDKPDESQIVETSAMSGCEIIETDLIASSVKDIDDNDENETKSVENPLCDANYTKETAVENKAQNLLTEQTKEIKSNNCDSKQTEDMNKQENGIDRDTKSFSEEIGAEKVVIPSSTDVCSVVEENNKLESNNEVLKEKEILVVEDGIATDVVTDEKITAINKICDKQDINKCTNETQERTDNNDNEEKNNATINVVDKMESPKEDLQVEEEEKAASSKVIEIEKL